MNINMYKLSFIFLCTFFSFQCQGVPTSEVLAKILEECSVEAKIDKSIILNTIETGELPTIPEYKDFLFCSYKKQGYQTEDGRISPSGFKNLLKEFYKGSAVDEIVDSCVGNCNNCNPGETAFDALQCILKQINEYEETLETNEIRDTDKENMLKVTEVNVNGLSLN